MNEYLGGTVMMFAADLEPKGQWHPAKKAAATSEYANTTQFARLFLAVSSASKH
jgi:hypothetical protein